jgi:hypothetical protein
MVQHAIEVVRLRSTPALIERYAPLLAVVCGTGRDDDAEDLLATLETLEARAGLDAGLCELGRLTAADPDAG